MFQFVHQAFFAYSEWRENPRSLSLTLRFLIASCDDLLALCYRLIMNSCGHDSKLLVDDNTISKVASNHDKKVVRTAARDWR